MIVENTKQDLENQKNSILEEIEVLKKHCSLLSEVMVNAKERVINEKANMHQREGNEEAYQTFLHMIYKTEASIISCQSFIEECNQKIAAGTEKIKHFDILLNSSDTPHNSAAHPRT